MNAQVRPSGETLTNYVALLWVKLASPGIKYVLLSTAVWSNTGMAKQTEGVWLVWSARLHPQLAQWVVVRLIAGILHELHNL